MRIELPPGDWQVEIIRPVSIYSRPDRRLPRRRLWRRLWGRRVTQTTNEPGERTA